ncbi:MAG: thioredoxin family protein [Deltaproteobacteria bacterium]|nr:thioredoxin family protein [Deltaproteobacteria bacterium]
MQKNLENTELAIGEHAPYFSLPGTDGRIYSLSSFGSPKALVIIFTANHCPHSQAYEEKLVELAKTFQPKGVQFLAICANDPVAFPEDNFERMVEKSRELALPFPYLYDEEQVAAKAFDAACTPEVYLFDAKLRLQYHGSIDDDPRNSKTNSTHYLREAIVSVLAGEFPKTPLTPVIGCSIKWK